MGYLKKIIIFLAVFFLALITLGSFNLEADEILSVYGKVKFGMPREEIDKIMQSQGKIFECVGGDVITDGKLFDQAVKIVYRLTPISKKCYGLAVLIPGIVDYKRIEMFLIDKHGQPTHPVSYFSYLPYGNTIWLQENVVITLMDGEMSNFPGKRIIEYADKNLYYIMQEEELKLGQPKRSYFVY